MNARIGAAGILLLAVSGCAVQSPDALPFHARSIERHADGTIAKGLLAQPVSIGGVPCRGWVRLHPDGSLSSYELATDATVQGHTLPAATYVWLDEHGGLKTLWLSQDTVIQGQTCRGGPFRHATSFHPDGSLFAFFPRDDVVIDGIPCASNPQVPVYLHPNGRPSRCRLAADVVVGGQTLRRGADAEFDDRGVLVQR